MLNAVKSSPSILKRQFPSLQKAFFSSGNDWSSYMQWANPTEADCQQNPVEAVFEAGMRHHHTANTAYPIGHKVTTRPYRVRRTRDQTELREVTNQAYGPLKEMMLYAHVPFCQTRCQFCEYTVVDPKLGKQDDVQQTYFDAMIKELEMYRDVCDTKQKKLIGFDIGGGTPSFASIQNIERVVEAARASFKFDEKMEISIETTPKIAASDPEKIKAYYDMGIRRISMGLQTMDFDLAKKLNRNDESYVTKSVENIRKAGFKSFNIDLMYGFPIRDGRDHKWAQTVRDTIDIAGPEHITLYRMRYKGTRMAGVQSRVKLPQVNSQEAEARQVLEAAGFHGWMGKNTFSRTPGSSGCSDYLEKRVLAGVPYIGLGLGAQSFSRHTLAYNLGAVTKRMFQYLKSVELGRLPIQDLYHLPIRGAMGKFCSVSFYFGGIHKTHFRENFGVSLEESFPREVEFVKRHGLMKDDGERLAMTASGKKHFAGVVSLFYSPAVQSHLISLPGGDPFCIPAERALSSYTPFVSPETVDEQRIQAAKEAAERAQEVTKGTERFWKTASIIGSRPDLNWDEPAPVASSSPTRAVHPTHVPDLEGDWARINEDGSQTLRIGGVILQRPAAKSGMSARPLSTLAGQKEE